MEKMRLAGIEGYVRTTRIWRYFDHTTNVYIRQVKKMQDWRGNKNSINEVIGACLSAWLLPNGGVASTNRELSKLLNITLLILVYNFLARKHTSQSTSSGVPGHHHHRNTKYTTAKHCPCWYHHLLVTTLRYSCQHKAANNPALEGREDQKFATQLSACQVARGTCKFSMFIHGSLSTLFYNRKK
jgi:hypothetical protein